MILTLKGQNDQLKASVVSKDNEIKQLELKVLRLSNLTHQAASTSDASKTFNGPEENEEMTLDGVMITQRGQKLANEGKDSVYCPFTQNQKFETFLEDLFDMRIG